MQRHIKPTRPIYGHNVPNQYLYIFNILFTNYICEMGRSQWSCGLMCVCVRPLTLTGIGNSIPPRGHGYLSLVSGVCCQVEVSASDWSLIQRIPTDCGVSECHCGTSEQWGGLGALGRSSNEKLCKLDALLFYAFVQCVWGRRLIAETRRSPHVHG